MRRRRLLKAVGSTAAVGLIAGCTDEEAETTEVGDPNGTSPTETSTETGTETTAEDNAPENIDGNVGDIPQNLEITSREIYRTNGEVGLRGTVRNTGDTAYAYVEAEATLQDDQGDVLYEFIDETEESDIDRLNPGKEWQFDFVFEEAQMSEVRAYTIDLEGFLVNEDADFGDIQGEVDQQEPNLEITSHHLTRQESTTFVTGTIRNVGEEDIDSVEVSVTLYDDNDNELFDFTDTVEEEEDRQTLGPGQAWHFRVTFEDIDMKNVARYVITANSDVV